jgi:hypothetical protein
MVKITASIRIDNDVFEHSRKNPLISNFSNWCNDKYRDEFMSIEKTALKINELYETIEILKDNIKDLKQKQIDQFDILTPQELNWIRTDALKRPHPYNEGVYKFFVNTFNRRDINRRQFHEILKRLEND